MSLYGSGYAGLRSTTDVASMSMDQLIPMLCKESKGDAYACIDCKISCPFGKRACELLEKETRKTMTPMTKKQQYAANQKITAMHNYLEAMSAPDPVKFIMEKYGSETERVAKNKIYQWQHNYGTNLNRVSNMITEIQAEIVASFPKMMNESPEEIKPVIEEKIETIPLEPKKHTKRQEEKISQSNLEQLRMDFENEYLGLEQQIEDHKKGIEECEKKIQAIVEKVNAIRAVLEIYKEKDARYV